jgi:hypothetical protein
MREIAETEGRIHLNAPDSCDGVAARTDNRIEPIPRGVRQLTDDQSNAIIEIARRERQVFLPDAV